MAQLRLGCPLKGNFFEFPWNSITVFDLRRIALSTCIGLILGACAAALCYYVDSKSLPLGLPSSLEVLCVMIALIIGHETLHLAGFPRLGFDKNTVIGIWPEMASPYVQYISPMRRNRFIFATLLPLLTLSLVPVILLSVGSKGTEYLNWIAVLNCIGAGSDIFIAYSVLRVVPKNALVLESDSKLYWTPFQSTDNLIDYRGSHSH